MRYQTNGIYTKIKINKLDCANKYILSEENKWLLVYGDELSVPKLVLIVTMMDNSESLDSEITSFERLNFKLFKDFGLPIYRMRFTLKGFDNEILISEGIEFFTRSNAANLYEYLFKKFNINKAKHTSTKKLNYATASPLQDWQRNYLNAVVIDFDIIELKDGQLNKVLELKRSIIALQSWRPWTDDYPNFYLALRFLDTIPFYIIYNQRKKEPTLDLVDKLSVFYVFLDNQNKIKIEHKGYHEFNKIFN